MTVRATDGTQTLLKHALAVPRGSGECSAAHAPGSAAGSAPAARLQPEFLAAVLSCRRAADDRSGGGGCVRS